MSSKKMEVVVPAHVVQEIRQSCQHSNVRGAANWKNGDGKGHRQSTMEQLVAARCAEWGVAKILSRQFMVSSPDFTRDQRATCDLRVMINSELKRVEVKSTTLRSGETPAQAVQCRGFTFQTHRLRNGRLTCVNPLFDPHHSHHETARKELVCGAVVEMTDNAVTVHACRHVWLKTAGSLRFEPMRRRDLRGFKVAVY